QRLADISPTELPPDFERPESQSFHGATHYFDVAPTMRGAVARLAQSRGCTPFVVLLAAFLALLHRRTDQDDLAVGTAFAGRGHTDLEELLGFFVNTVVLRTDLGGDPRFSDLLRRVSDTVEEAARHQEMPFERLVEELVPERDLSRNALFQVWFNLVPVALPEPALSAPGVAELELELLDLDHETARLELALILRETAGGYRACLEYATDLYSEETIERLAEDWLRILAAAVADPARRLSELSFDDQSSDGASVPAGAPRSTEPRECVSALLAEEAARRPGQIAVRCGETTLTYGELLERADSLARELGRRLPKEAGIVGLVADRSVHTPIGMLGVLRAGAAYLPLDPTYPRERLELMLDEAGADAIVAGPASREQANFGLPVIEIDGIDGEAATPGVAAPPPRPHLDELAYVMFTSGSSGRPKGVMVTRRNLAYSNLARREWYGEPPQRFLLTSPLSFDSSVVGLYWPLLTGGTLILAEEGRQGDPHAIAESIERYRVTHLCILPSLWALVLEEAMASRLTSLETVIVAGETCPASLPRRHRARLPGTELVNEYGPTEATVWCSAHRSIPSEEAGSRVPIGRPIPGTSIRILDDSLAEVRSGVTGEIFVAGPGVARGYVNRPRLTAERFLPDPAGESPGGRLYRTGDLGRSRDDGTIEFLGRADTQVKIRGHRVELEEVEAALAALPGVSEAAVCQRRIGAGVVLAAFVTGSLEDGRGLRRELESRLPPFMLPDTIRPLDELPRTPSGKIDREALPEPAADRADGSIVAARSPVERCLARLWCEVLGLAEVGIEDSFFEVGGNSLRAAVIVNRFLEERDEPLSLEMHLRGVTIRRIAQRLAETMDREVGGTRSGREGAIPAGDEALLAKLDELSEEEVRETLRALLAERESKS
ncbi:MAG: amino acid adenylation domain-containing protein, partial [Thermoanaerobaculia bacterium]|nr:amino acid adenylation domain-containing protein [Thermoanaerobaculia bacterium]